MDLNSICFYVTYVIKYVLVNLVFGKIKAYIRNVINYFVYFICFDKYNELVLFIYCY